MTDWLEELMDQVEEADAAQGGMELSAGHLLRGRSEWTGPRDRGQTGPVQTTGQGETPAEELAEGAVFAAEQVFPSRSGREDRAEGPMGGQVIRETADPGREGAGWTDGGQQAALPRERAAAEGLYRRLVRTGWRGESSRRTERAVVVERQFDGPSPLTVEQLDRAVRRDSRRYDGGMELY